MQDTASSTLEEFSSMTAYLGSSPKLLDTAISASLIQGNPRYLIQGLAVAGIMALLNFQPGVNFPRKGLCDHRHNLNFLGGHVLLATGGTAPRSLRKVSAKGVSEPMAKAAAGITGQMRKVLTDSLAMYTGLRNYQPSGREALQCCTPEP